MNQEKKYLDGFRDWWIAQGHSKRSADSYRSRVKRANIEFYLPIVGKDLFEALDDGIANGKAVDWLYALSGRINYQIKLIDNIVDKKSLQDIRSKLDKFTDYIAVLQEACVESGISGDDIELAKMPEGMQYYDQDELIRYFSFRLGSQDFIRKDMAIFYPIRLIRKLFLIASCEKKALLKDAGILEADGQPIKLLHSIRTWTKSFAGNIIFHTEKRNYTLSEIDGLLIDSNRKSAWVRIHNKDILLLSEVTNGLHAMKVKALSGIRLDRSERIEETLNRLAPILIIMRMLTDDIKESAKGKAIPVTHYKKNGENIEEIEVMEELDKFSPMIQQFLIKWYSENADWNRIAPWLPLILKELNYIAAATTLTAMSREDELNRYKMG